MPTEKENALGTKIVRKINKKKTKIKVDRTKISVILCYMENKNTNNNTNESSQVS